MSITKPTILTDKSRLQEIYDLRLEAYENSPKSIYVNRLNFPNGLFDELDEKEDTIHWIVEDDRKIVATARISILYKLNDIKDLDSDFDNYNIPKERPFAYYSRLVVHHQYRKLGIVNELDEIRVKYITSNENIKFAIAWATSDRNEGLIKIGFNKFGLFNYTWGG